MKQRLISDEIVFDYVISGVCVFRFDRCEHEEEVSIPWMQQWGSNRVPCRIGPSQDDMNFVFNKRAANKMAQPRCGSTTCCTYGRGRYSDRKPVRKRTFEC